MYLHTYVYIHTEINFFEITLDYYVCSNQILKFLDCSFLLKYNLRSLLFTLGSYYKLFKGTKNLLKVHGLGHEFCVIQFLK